MLAFGQVPPLTCWSRVTLSASFTIQELLGHKDVKIYVGIPEKSDQPGSLI